jgi:hypothetical protein
MDCQAFTELDDANYFPPKKTKKYGRHPGSNILCKLCFILGEHFNNSNNGFIIKLVLFLKGGTCKLQEKLHFSALEHRTSKVT